MFAAPLKLKNFSGDFLEKAFVRPNDYAGFLAEICFKLLRADASANYVPADSEGVWEVMLSEKLRQQWQDFFPNNPLAEKGFFDVTAVQRVSEGMALRGTVAVPDLHLPAKQRPAQALSPWWC